MRPNTITNRNRDHIFIAPPLALTRMLAVQLIMLCELPRICLLC